MKKTQNRKIMAALKDLEAGMTTREVAEKYGTTHGTISKWKLKYGTKTQKMTKNIPFGSVPETLVPSTSQNIPSLVPSSNESEDNYDYDDEANDLLEEYFKTHDRNDVSGIYFDENGKLELKKAMELTDKV